MHAITIASDSYQIVTIASDSYQIVAIASDSYQIVAIASDSYQIHTFTSNCPNERRGRPGATRGKGSIASRRKVLPAAEYSECRSVARSAHAHAAHALCSMEW